MGGKKRQTGTTCCAPTSQRRLACALAQRGASVLADGFGPGTHRLPDTARRFLPSEGAHRFHRAVRPRHPPTVGPFQKDLEIRPKLGAGLHASKFQERFIAAEADRFAGAKREEKTSA